VKIITHALVGSALVLLAGCSSLTPREARPQATSRGSVSDEVVASAPEGRYEPEQNTSYEQPAPYPDNPPPNYPAALLSQKLPPTVVTVRLVVGADGVVAEVVPIEPVTGLAEGQFYESVHAAVVQWKFLPLVRVIHGKPSTVIAVGDMSTTYDGQATALPFSQTYRFTFSQLAGVPTVDAAKSAPAR
jgi:hypothetical protein